MDITVFNAGSIIILSGATQRGKEWLEDNLPEDTMRWGINGWVIEPRYVQDILVGAIEDGLNVEGCKRH